MNIHESISPIIARRSWNLGKGGLTGIAIPEPWLPGSEPTAQCAANESHAAPADDCRCGLHAVARPETAPPAAVIGRVALRGSIVEHGRTPIACDVCFRTISPYRPLRVPAPELGRGESSMDLGTVVRIHVVTPLESPIPTVPLPTPVPTPQPIREPARPA